MKITQIKTSRHGIINTQEALELLKDGKALNAGSSQIVMGIYEDGRETSLKGRKDGFYYMSGNFCSEA